jgi:uncharacterized metal-binding protein (TIGR02443 family)
MNMTSKPQRRFIAGAVCPACGALDKIVVDLESDQRQCVSCGFAEERPQAPASASGELSTRVSRPAARRLDTPTEAVTLVDLKKGD